MGMEKFHLQNKQTNKPYSYDLPKRAYLAHEKETQVWLLLPARNESCLCLNMLIAGLLF